MRKIVIKNTFRNLSKMAIRLGINYNFDGTFGGKYCGYKVHGKNNTMCFYIMEIVK